MRKSHAGMAKQTKGRRLQISVPSSPFGWLVCSYIGNYVGNDWLSEKTLTNTVRLGPLYPLNWTDRLSRNVGQIPTYTV